MKQLFVMVLLVLALTAGVAYAEKITGAKYICPMHPQIISEIPGKCPICGMDLVSAGGEEHRHETGAPAQTERKVLYWYDPMKPGTKFDKPGKSPFMDMELVPKYAESDSPPLGGKPTVSISAENIQKMGVRIERVVKSSFGQGIRATGIVMPNERTRVDMFSQVEGRVEDLKRGAVGDPVKKGEVFYTLVSPELSTLQNDYLVALSGGLKDMTAAARNRMKLLGIDDITLGELTKRRAAFEKMPFHIPADGVLAKLEIRNGHYLKAGDEIGHIQDLSIVWIEAAVVERDAATIRMGDIVKVMMSDRSKAYAATVDYIYPTVNAEARTVKVRLVVENKEGVLKPDSYATVEFSATTSERVTVPSEAVLRSGTGNHVIIPLGEGKFQARNVETGIASGGRTEIIEGLKEGEDVVVSSQFMIDSESSLKESLQKFSMPSMEMDHGK